MKTQVFDGDIQFQPWPKGVKTMQCDGYTITRIPPMKPRHFVRMFQPRFAALVESGAKLQTVRPVPKRMPRAGDRISLRTWTGKPYRSKQRVLREVTITAVWPVQMTMGDADQLLLSVAHGTVDEEAFARADGFNCARSMTRWFIDQHGLPFNGIVIFWK